MQQELLQSQHEVEEKQLEAKLWEEQMVREQLGDDFDFDDRADVTQQDASVAPTLLQPPIYQAATSNLQSYQGQHIDANQQVYHDQASTQGMNAQALPFVPNQALKT